MASGEIDVSPGRSFGAGEVLDWDKINEALQLVLRIKEGAISARELADGGIPASKVDVNFAAQLGVASGAVGTAQLVDGSVTTTKLAAGGVTADRLASSLDLSGKSVTLASTAIVSALGVGSVLQVVQKGVLTGTLINQTTAQGAAFLHSGGVALKDAASPATDLSTVITPASASNKVLLEALVFGGNATAISLLTLGVFRNAISTTEASAVAQVSAEKGDVMGVYLSFLDAPASTSAVAYTWRAGRGSNTSWTSGGPSTLNFNGKMIGWVRATEVKG